MARREASYIPCRLANQAPLASSPNLCSTERIYLPTLVDMNGKGEEQKQRHQPSQYPNCHLKCGTLLESRQVEPKVKRENMRLYVSSFSFQYMCMVSYLKKTNIKVKNGQNAQFRSPRSDPGVNAECFAATQPPKMQSWLQIWWSS